MEDLKSEINSYEGLSYSNSVSLSSWKISKAQSSLNLSDIRGEKEESNLLGELFNEDVTETSQIHTCLNWLSKNKTYNTELLPPLLSAHNSTKHTENNIKSIKLTLKKILNLINKINFIKKIKRKNRKIGFDYNLCNKLVSKFDSNTNWWCIPSRVSKEHSDSDNKKDERFNRENTFSSHEKSSTEIEKSSESSEGSEQDSEKLLLNKINKQDSDVQKPFSQSDDSLVPPTEIEKIPNLVISPRRSFRRKTSLDATTVHEGNALYRYIDILAKSRSSKSLVPSDYKICYTFFIYMYPSNTDANLLLFQRHELKSISKFMDPFDLMNLIADTKADFLFDRRLKMVQNQCNCCIILKPLEKTFINGLPYRSLNIYSFNYENIAKALSIMEDAMPEIMQTCVFKYTLPSTCSSKWSSKNMVLRPIKRSIRTESFNKTWFNRIEPDLRFSSFNYIVRKGNPDIPTEKSWNRIIPKFVKCSENEGENTFKTASRSDLHIFAENNASNVGLEFESDLSGISDGKRKENINESNLIEDLRKKISENCHLKKIKCPASILKREIFSDPSAMNNFFQKFHCKIIKIDNPDVKEGETGSKEDQVKLTIIYNLKEQLHEFCNELGLCKG